MKSETARARWRPVDVAGLEDAADDVVRSFINTLVVAGPGAGKTELLAQRACFLLQTGSCPDPQRILAISMKRDAARNLKDRVSKRCGRELSSRFDSQTFDSFSKGLVDRFLSVIPEPFRPTADYAVLDGKRLNERKALEYAKTIPLRQLGLSEMQLQGINPKPLWRAFVGRPLPADGKWTNTNDAEIAAAALWRFMIAGGTGAAIGFPMLGRMAELILRTNPLVLSALQKSYRFVFLDEFQDTSSIHYHLIFRAFAGMPAILTAVGDHKQRIMGWAGAMPKIFEHFTKDFSATSHHLTRNYRSSQQLVDIQSVIAASLDKDAVNAVSMVADDLAVGECRVLAFSDDENEARYLAAMVAKWIQQGIPPRKICILCRMKPAVYTQRLQHAFAKAGVRSRIENELQDLLSEPLSQCVLDFVKLAVKQTSPDAWGQTLLLLGEMRGADSDVSKRRIVDSLYVFTQALHISIEKSEIDEKAVLAVLNGIMTYVGQSEFRAANPQYLQGDWYASVLSDLAKALSHALDGKTWSKAVDDVEGLDSVPIMTTHKSKGLEYHSIIFVGLEDSAHFSFKDNPAEETCGFFVALSRAERRVIFTFSGSRPTGWGGRQSGQDRNALKPLYDLLDTAGVEIEDIDDGDRP